MTLPLIGALTTPKYLGLSTVPQLFPLFIYEPTGLNLIADSLPLICPKMLVIPMIAFRLSWCMSAQTKFSVSYKIFSGKIQWFIFILVGLADPTLIYIEFYENAPAYSHQLNYKVKSKCFDYRSSMSDFAFFRFSSHNMLTKEEEEHKEEVIQFTEEVLQAKGIQCDARISKIPEDELRDILLKVRELRKKKKKQLDTEVLKGEEDNIYNR